MAYDKAEWHLDDWPEDVPEENAGTHIGLFLAWCFKQGFAGELHTDDVPRQVREVVTGKMTGREFLTRYCDGAFTDEDLNDEGNAFAAAYYETEDYLEDFEELFVNSRTKSVYHVQDTPASLKRISTVLNRRFKEWKDGSQQELTEKTAAMRESLAHFIDIDTGTLHFEEPAGSLGPSTTRTEFLESELATAAEVWVANEEWCSWKLAGGPKLDGRALAVVVQFHAEKLTGLSMAPYAPDVKGWDDYDAEAERRGAKAIEEWLRTRFGETREFPWGSIAGGMNPRDQVAFLMVRYGS